ncbi:MAG: hypothetical protein ACM30H_01325 [Clostridia bacterium]
MDKQAEIKAEILKAFEGFGAEPQLLAVVASWGELSDAVVLEMLRNWNNGTFRSARITSVERPKPTLTVVR